MKLFHHMFIIFLGLYTFLYTLNLLICQKYYIQRWKVYNKVRMFRSLWGLQFCWCRRWSDFRLKDFAQKTHLNLDSKFPKNNNDAVFIWVVSVRDWLFTGPEQGHCPGQPCMPCANIRLTLTRLN